VNPLNIHHELSCPLLAARNFRLIVEILCPVSKIRRTNEALPKRAGNFSHWQISCGLVDCVRARKADWPSLAGHHSRVLMTMLAPRGRHCFFHLPLWREIEFHSQSQRGQAEDACYISASEVQLLHAKGGPGSELSTVWRGHLHGCSLGFCTRNGCQKHFSLFPRHEAQFLGLGVSKGWLINARQARAWLARPLVKRTRLTRPSPLRFSRVCLSIASPSPSHQRSVLIAIIDAPAR
jgi:hypothetical protein